MKILHICDGMPPATLGGAGNIMCELSRAQADAGNEIHILTVASATAKHQSGPWTVHTVPTLPQRFAHMRSVFSRSRAREVMNIINTIKPDVIHAHAIAFQIGYLWTKTAREYGYSIVVTCHDAMLVRYGKAVGNERFPALMEARRFRWSYNPLRHVMIRRLLANARAITAVSDALRAYLMRYGIEPMKTIHNGIDMRVWKPTESRQAARARLELPFDRCYFLIAGRLGGDKGLGTALKALPANAGLIIAGEASQWASQNDTQHLHFFPRQSAENMRALYAACDAVLVPSEYLDPFPTVCLEAMAMGRAVLSTSMGGAQEAVQHEKTGWILDPSDLRIWKQQMEWCVQHRTKLDTMGIVGRKHANEYFSIGRMMKNVEHVYEQVRSKAHII